MKKLLWLYLPSFLMVILVGYIHFKKTSRIPEVPKQENELFPSPTPLPVIYHGSKNSKKVALTFDADMTPLMEDKLQKGLVKSYYNQKISEILEKENISATLFLTGLWAKNYPAATRQLAANPLFEIGNHSYSHPSFSSPCFGLQKIDEKQKIFEFEESQKILKQLTGKSPHFFRFPGGCFLQDDLKLAQKYSLQVVQWDVESGDAFNNNTNQIVKNVTRSTEPGSIVVFHLNGSTNAPKTAEALPAIIHYLKAKGFQFVTIGELLKNSISFFSY